MDIGLLEILKEKEYITDAVKTLEKHFFDVGFNKIEIRCSSRNLRSANVPKTCGYIFDGALRSDGFDSCGLRDTFVFSKLKEDYFKDHINIKTEHDFEAVIDIAKKNNLHFTESGVALIARDFHFQSGLIYRSEEKVVGFILYVCNQGIAEICWMGVTPEKQGCNIGKKLLSELVNKLREKEIKSLTVKTLDESVNYQPYEKTRGFYLKNGFQKIQVISHPENLEYEAEVIFKLEIA